MVETLNKLWLRLQWWALPFNKGLHIPYQKCSLCQEEGVWRFKRVQWGIGNVLDYCAFCDKYRTMDCNWNFWYARPETYGDKTTDGYPQEVTY